MKKKTVILISIAGIALISAVVCAILLLSNKTEDNYSIAYAAGTDNACKTYYTVIIERKAPNDDFSVYNGKVPAVNSTEEERKQFADTVTVGDTLRLTYGDQYDLYASHLKDLQVNIYGDIVSNEYKSTYPIDESINLTVNTTLGELYNGRPERPTKDKASK